MKKMMLVMLMAWTLTGCADKMDCGGCAYDVHTWGQWSDAVYNDKLEKEVQERNCLCCNIKDERKVGA